MKPHHCYFSLLLLFSAIAVKAQPQFTAAQFPSAGTQDSFRLCSILPSWSRDVAATTGSNYTWDFTTGTAFSPSGHLYGFVMPNPSEYLSYPPTANLRETSVGYPIDNLFEKADTLFLLRSGSSASSGTVVLPKIPWMIFPKVYGDSMSFTQTEYANAAMTVPTFKRTHSFKYDGFGKVVLPWGSYINALRVKMTTRDSSYVFANSFVTYSDYYWFPQSGGNPIVHMYSASQGDSINRTFTVIANKTAMGSTGLDGTAAIAGISIYPIPAQDAVWITNFTLNQLQAELYSIDGRIGTKRLLATGENRILLTDFPAGVYSIVIRSDNGQTIRAEQLLKR